MEDNDNLSEIIDSVDKRLVKSIEEYYKPAYSREHEVRAQLKEYVSILKNTPDKIQKTDADIIKRLHALDPGKRNLIPLTILSMIIFGTWWGHMHGGFRISTAVCPVIALSFLGLFIGKWKKTSEEQKGGFFSFMNFGGIVGLVFAFPLLSETYNMLLQHGVSKIEAVFSFITMCVAGGFAVIPFYGRTWIRNLFLSVSGGFFLVMIGIGIMRMDLSSTTAVFIQAASGIVFGLAFGLNMAFLDRKTIKDPTEIYVKIYTNYQNRIDAVVSNDTG